MTAMPVLFLAHGAPVLMDDEAWVAELGAWGRALPRPRAILMVSAHWEAQPATLGATSTVPLVYDFYGFPEKYYRLAYPAPGAPALAERVRALLGGAGIAVTDEPKRGLDHGAFIPLLCMFPAAEIPVLQLSMPSLDPAELFAMGRALAPLRDEGVLMIGSGFLIHNMRSAFRSGIPAWAHEFDAWSTEVLGKNDVDALLDYRRRAPAVTTALPTTEHFDPILFSVGAAPDAHPTFPITGWWMNGAFTKRSLQLG